MIAIDAGQFDRLTTAIGIPLGAAVIALLITVEWRALTGRRVGKLVAVAAVLALALGAIILARFARLAR
jgi:hypothetical protein